MGKARITSPKPQPPAAIPVLNPITVDSSTQFTGDWGSAADATGYEMQWSTSAAFDSFGHAVLPNTLSHAVSGLTPSTTYNVRLRSLRTNAPPSNWSRPLRIATTHASSPPALIRYDATPGITDDNHKPANPLDDYNTRLLIENESWCFPPGFGTGLVGEALLAARRAEPISTANLITRFGPTSQAFTDGKDRIEDEECDGNTNHYRDNSAQVHGRFGTICSTIRGCNPTVKFSMYNLFPQFLNIQPGYQYFTSWRARNDGMYAAIGQYVDFTVSKMYAFEEPGVGNSFTLQQVIDRWSNTLNYIFEESVRFGHSLPNRILVKADYNSGRKIEDEFWDVMKSRPKQLGYDGAILWEGDSFIFDTGDYWYQNPIEV